MVPVYWRAYGPTNFLWFCDAAMVVTVAAVWLESALLVSACAAGILLPQCVWLADFGGHLLGFRGLGLSDYMFDPQLPLFTRGLSLFHGWLPVLLLWLLGRLGYDRRGWLVWTFLATTLLVLSLQFSPPPGARPADPNTPVNINYVYGMSDRSPQVWVNPSLYVLLWGGALFIAVNFPTHLVLRWIYAAPGSSRRGARGTVGFIEP